MKKALLTITAAVIAIGAMSIPKAPTVREMQQEIASGKMRKAPKPHREKIRSAVADGIGESNIGRTVAPVSPSSLDAARLKKSPARATEEGANIYGYLYYASDWNLEPGLYELMDNDSYELKWIDPVYWYEWYTPSNGWYTDGKIAGVSIYWYYGYVAGYFSYETDFETGELIDFQMYDYYSFDVMLDVCTLNPDDGQIYGYAVDLAQGGYYWATASPETPDQVEEIRYAGSETCLSLCFNPEDGYFYGINLEHNFVKIAKDGTQTVISSLPDEDFDDFTTGLVWSPTAKLFYWNANFIDYSSALYTITSDGQFDRVANYEFEEQFTFFVTTDEFVNPDTPLAPIVKSVDFAGGSLTGTITYTLPSEYGDGRPLPASIEYTAQIDNTTFETGTASPGSELSVTYTVAESGTYTFSLYVSVESGDSKGAYSKLYVGNDTPLAPTNVVLTDSKISWSAVTEGVHGGYIDAASMTYEVFIDGQSWGTTKETSMQLDFPTDTPLERRTAEVIAICNGLQSAAASSNSIVTGEPLTTPLFLVPTEEEFELMVTYDANGDGRGWYLDSNGLYSGYTDDYNVDMDDYIFLPPLHLDGETSYSFNMKAGLISSWYPDEWVEVVFATSPDPGSVQKIIVDPYQPTALPSSANNFSTWDEVESLFTVPESGTYYIGLHCLSPGDGVGLIVKDILLTPGTSPAAVADLTATPSAPGALNANLAFDMPTLALDGSVLNTSSSLTALIGVNGVPSVASASGVPGSPQTVNVPTVQGTNVISVIIYDGDLRSPETTVSVFTGVNVPATPTNVQLASYPDMMGGVLTWDAVTTADVEGGYVDPADITYQILAYNTLNPTWTVIEEGVTGTTYTATLQQGAPQAQYGWGVRACNAAGNNGQYAYKADILGTPYTLPLTEEFCDDGPTITPWFRWPIDGVYGSTLIYELLSRIDPVFADSQDFVILGTNATGEPGPGMLSMPRFSTKGHDNVSFTMDYMTGPQTCSVDVYGKIYGSDDLILIGTVPASDGDQKKISSFTFQLPEELTNQDWVMVYFEMYFEDIDDLFVLSEVNVKGDGETTILSMTADKAIISGQKTITLKGFEKQSYSISDIDGRSICRGIASDKTVTVSVEPGIYVVKAGDRQAKVLVK